MTGLTNNQALDSERTIPHFFSEIHERASKRWEQLESDPEDFGVWQSLFGQVQIPRHVLSELLQNADDVGAKRARATVVNGQFEFEHDGTDFDEDQFASLCRFGFSNKRKLHTIGFRGIGFKSTFSLGDTVEVLTPSLAVRFNKRRFTEPRWMEDALPTDVTRIAVRIQDPDREKELRENLAEWVDSPVSLLFFNNINEVTIGDVTLRKRFVAHGPVAGSERVVLSGCGERDLLIFRSSEEPFPDDAVREIRQERNTENLHLSTCRVELVVGLPGKQRLYVVLPTGVTIGMPFSCNAPFLQDPARAAIKATSMSPTNRWLLQRLGRLAGASLLGWLESFSLPLDIRADAYRLLPEKTGGGDSVEADAISSICQGFSEAVGEKPLLLTTEGQLVGKGMCIAPPMDAHSVWTPTELLEVFGEGREHILSETVAERYRRRLQSWSWLDLLDTTVLINRLGDGRPIPRPTEHENLLTLWSIVQRSVRYDYGGQQRRRLTVVPVEGADVLFPANDVVRLSSKKETISDESWDLLAGLVRIIDRQWVEHLGKPHGQNAKAEEGRQLLRDLGLERPSDVNDVVANACQRFFAQSQIALHDCVQVTGVIAALDAKTPDGFKCFTRKGELREPAFGMVATLDSSMDELFPQEWTGLHFLHPEYFRDNMSCTRQEWQRWLTSDKSGFYPFVKLDKSMTFNTHDLRRKVKQFINERQGPNSVWFYAQVQSVDVEDYDFDESLIAFWKEAAKNDPMVWARVATKILFAPSWYWENCQKAILRESNYSHTRRLCDSVLAGWIVRLSSLPCLPDTQGTVHVPAEVYLRTPETEPLMGVEPFVRAELDTEATKPLLRLLGVRDTPAGLDKLLGRIRALAATPNPLPLLHEIIKWYGALDRVLARCDSRGLDEVREAFRDERLIITGSGEWGSTADVFQRAGEDDLPDVPVIHPSVQGLSIWVRLGVAERVSADLVLDWLCNLGSGHALEPATVRRVRSALQRYPERVWEKCRHWLSLDNTWTPVEELTLRLTMRGLTKWGDLFPVIKSRTANMQMLTAQFCDRQPFSSLPDLGASIEYHLTEPPRDPCRPVEKPWLMVFSDEMQRVKFIDDGQTQRARHVAARLGRSVWRPFRTIAVTPYIDGTPAGEPHSPDALWYEETIFVREGRLAKSFDALVAELARPFENDAVTEAMKVCIERDERFITEYMEEHFTLEFEPAPPLPIVERESEEGEEREKRRKTEAEMEPESDPVAADGLQPDSPCPEGPAGSGQGDDEDAEPEKEQPPTRREPRQPILFERFALDRGFRWDHPRQRFAHPVGSWIERCNSPFHWQRFDVEGNVVTRYWASQQCLSRGGVEIASEVWELIRGMPESCSLILVDEADRPIELAGINLVRMVEDKRIKLYPAKYRIREELNHG